MPSSTNYRLPFFSNLSFLNQLSFSIHYFFLFTEDLLSFLFSRLPKLALDVFTFSSTFSVLCCCCFVLSSFSFICSFCKYLLGESTQFSSAQLSVSWASLSQNSILLWSTTSITFFSLLLSFLLCQQKRKEVAAATAAVVVVGKQVWVRNGENYGHWKKRVGGVSYVVLGSTKNLQRQLFMIITISCCCCCQCCCCCCNSWYCFGSWCSRCQESVCACVLAKLTSTVILCFVFKKSLQNTQMPFPLLPLLFNSNNRNKTDFINLKNVKKILK